MNSLINKIRYFACVLVLLIACVLMTSCDTTLQPVSGQWIWVAKVSGKNVGQGFFNFNESTNGQIVGSTTSVAYESQNKQMYLKSLRLNGIRKKNKVEFTVRGINSVSKSIATIASDGNKMIGQTTTENKEGKETYEWTATRAEKNKAK